MSKRLKRCPFCGGKAAFEEIPSFGLNRVSFSVGCTDAHEASCPGFQLMTSWPTKAEAAEAWNRRAPDADLSAEVERLKEKIAFTEADSSRRLRKEDVLGVCPSPKVCFEYGDIVRCGPCAVKASAAAGVVISDTPSHLPEVCRMRREAKALIARAEAAEARVKSLLDLLAKNSAALAQLFPQQPLDADMARIWSENIDRMYES